MGEESQFCRLCLSTSVVYYSLLKNNGKEMVLSLTGIEVNEDDHSTESCAKCWLDLKLAYFIQQCFIEAEKKLKLNEIKVEFNSTEESTGIGNINGDFSAGNEGVKVEDNNEVSDDDSEYHELIYIQTEDVVEEKPCICSLCGMRCIGETNLYSHIQTHYNGPQTCDECLASLPNIPAYRDHIQTKHPNSYGKTYICGICSLTFKYLPLYNLHLSGLHPGTAKTGKKKIDVNMSNDELLKCKQCDKVFTNKASYVQHVKHHVKSLCPICGKKVSGYHLKKHIIIHQTKPVECDICGKTCKHSESLKWHMYNTHANLKKLTCPKCGQQFKKLYNYKLHLRRHSGIKTYNCSTCGKGFFTQYRMNVHFKMMHLKERPHICKYCNEAFARKDYLRTHERKHSNDLPYVCEICGEGFKQSSSLRGHEKSKHVINDRKILVFCGKNPKCPICKKTFEDEKALEGHTRSIHAK